MALVPAPWAAAPAPPPPAASPPPPRAGAAQGGGRQGTEDAAAAAAVAAARALQTAAAASRWPAPLPPSVAAAAAAATAAAAAAAAADAPPAAPASGGVEPAAASLPGAHSGAASVPAPPPAAGIWRVAFVFDCRDSQLFHALEDAVRRHNAVALGLARPGPASGAPALGLAAAAVLASPEGGQLGAGAEGTSSRGSLARGALAGGSSSDGAGASAGRGAGGLSGQRQQRRPSDRGPAHAHFQAGAAPGSGVPAAGTVPEDAGAASEAAARLARALAQYEGVPLEPRLLQALATSQLPVDAGGQPGGRQSGGGQSGGGQSRDDGPDVITGFQLVAGDERVVVLEVAAGPARPPPHLAPPLPSAPEEQPEPPQPQQQQPAWRAAREVVDALAAWALAGGPSQAPGAPVRARRVLHNPGITHPDRLYAPLGVALWMVKLRAGLEALAGEAGSYASGRVRRGPLALGRPRHSTVRPCVPALLEAHRGRAHSPAPRATGRCAPTASPRSRGCSASTPRAGRATRTRWGCGRRRRSWGCWTRSSVVRGPGGAG
jgi:hypothetical protein